MHHRNSHIVFEEYVTCSSFDPDRFRHTLTSSSGYPAHAAALMRSLVPLPLVLAALPLAVAHSDVGFENLFVSNAAEIERTCQSMSVPSYVRGSFILPSVSEFEVGEQKFVGLLDGFGKLQKFEFSDGQLCFKAKMMDTGFYNQSKAEGSIAPSLLFMETSPASGHSGVDNLKGPNDNVFVNPILFPGNDNFVMVTDSQLLMQFDPMTLERLGKIVFSDDLDSGNIVLGSAHPTVRHSDGCLLNVEVSLRHTYCVL